MCFVNVRVPQNLPKMKLVILLAFVCLSSAFPEYTADVLKFQMSPESGSGLEFNTVEMAETLKLTKFFQLLKRSGLQETLFVQGPFTLFAPSDEAFSKLSILTEHRLEYDTQLMTDVILYHIVEKEVFSSDFQNELVLPSRLEYTSVRINVYDKLVTVNGCPISNPDNAATNGVIHVIDNVMYPIPISDISTLIKVNVGFSTMMEAIRSAGLGDELKGGHYTLLVPTDDAFHKLPYGTIETLLSSKDMLIKVINNHLVDETVFSVALKQKKEITTVNKDTLTITTDANGVMSINDAKVVFADGTATNGVIFVIDTVLIPHDTKFKLVAV